MKKRIACLLLALVMLVGLIPVTAIQAKAASLSVSEAGVRVIKEYVGFHKNAYETYQGSGVYKIGYGTSSVAGATITEANADKLLREELSTIAQKISATIDSPELLVAKRMDALVWYTYAEGSYNWLSSDMMVNAVKNGETGSKLVNAMCTWNYQSTGFENNDANRGVIYRRMRMANLYLTGSYSAGSTGSLSFTVFDAGENASINGVRTSVQAFDGGATRITVAAPVKTNANFLGWYLDGQMVTGLSSSTAGKTLSAKWQETTDAVKALYTLPAEVIYTTSHNKDSVQVYIYKEPSTASTPIDILNRQTTVTVVYEGVNGEGKWLNLSTGGWVLLGNVDEVPASLTNEIVTITDDYVNIRKEPRATSAKVGTAKRGEQLTITMISNDGKWGYCSKGWIMLAYTTNSSPATSNGGATTAGTPGTVTGAAQVNVRKGAGVRNALATTLAEGTAVTVYERTTVDGAPWGRIDQGWISMGYVKLNQTQKPADGSAITAGSSAVVSSSVRLNVRSGPSASYSKVTTLAPGTSVVILRKQTTGGATWGLIDQGWINLSYVTAVASTDSGSSSVYSVGGTVVNCSTGVNIRAAAGTNNALVGVAGVGTRVNVSEIVEVSGFKWGQIERGWVCMDYIQLDSAFNKPTSTVPNTVEDEPSNVVDSFEGYPAVVSTEYKVTITYGEGTSATKRVDYGAALHETASAHSKSLLTLKKGASIRILAWAVSGNNLYGKVTVGDKTGWVSLNDVTMEQFNAKVTASKTDLYEGPTTRSKTFHTLIQGSYVTVPQGNSNWAISDNILWGQIQNADTGSSGWIMLKDVTMFRENVLPTGITTLSGVGYLTGTMKTNSTIIKDTNGNVTFKKDASNAFVPDYTGYTLTAGARVNIQARNYLTDTTNPSYLGRTYAKVTVGSVTGWIPVEDVTLDTVALKTDTTVNYYASLESLAADAPIGTIPSGVPVTIVSRELVRLDNEINHGVVDAGYGYIGDDTLNNHYYYFTMDNGQMAYVTQATVEDPGNPLIASSVVLTGKAIGDVYIREEATDSSNSLLKITSGSPITVVNWKSVDGITWGKVQINKVVGWVKAAEVDFDNLKGMTNVDQLKVYNLMDKTSAVQLLRTNNKRISIESVELRGNVLWGKAYVDGSTQREYLGYVDLSELNLNTPGIIGGADQTNLPVMAKGRINSVNVTCALVSREEGGQEIPGVLNLPKSTEVNLIGLRLRDNKAQWLVDLGDQDGWVDMDYVNMYSSVATIVTASAPVYDDLTLDKVLYTLYRDEKATVLSYHINDVNGDYKLYGEVACGDTTGWILLMDDFTNEANSMNRVLPVYLVPGSTGSNVGGGSNTTPTNPTTPTTPVDEGTPAYIVCATSVNVRSGAGVDNTLVTTLDNGTNVKIYEKTVVLGKEWARIDQGWVCMDYVRLGTLTTVPNGGNNGNSGTVTIITTVPSGAIAVGYANQDISIRSGSNMGYPEVGTLKKGQSIAIYENKLDGGMSWGRTDNGWICTSYLTITGIGVSGSGSMGTIARCGFTANVRHSANSNSPLMAKVMISSRIVIRETTTVGVETWVRTDLGWINMQYVVEDTATGGTAPTPTPTPTEPITEGDPNVSGGLGNIFYIPDGDAVVTPDDPAIGGGSEPIPGDGGLGSDTDPDEDYGTGDWGWG